MEKTLHIKANPGSPNTFWAGQSGRYYQTKRAAAHDKASEAVNPDDYRLTDTDTDSQDTVRTKKGRNRAIIAAAILAVAAIGVAIWFYARKRR